MREGCCAQVSFDGWGQARGPGVSGQEWVWDVGTESDATGSAHWPRSVKASCGQRGMVIGGRNQMSQHRLCGPWMDLTGHQGNRPVRPGMWFICAMLPI
jgi:hypothetical protein